MTSYQAVAKELDGAFEIAERPNNGGKFYRLKKDRPSWIGDGADLMRKVHQAVDDRMPDDWVYESAYFIADNLTHYDDLDAARDAIHEIADGLVDVYNSELTQWLASHGLNAGLCDEACNELGDPGDMFKRIQYGQFYALERIAAALLDAIEAEVEDREAAEVESD